MYFSTLGFKASLQHSRAIRAENQRVDFQLRQSMVAHCNICQVELRSLLRGNTLTLVPLAGTEFPAGEHTVQGSACRQVTSSWLLTFPPNSLSLRMIHPVLRPKKKKIQQNKTKKPRQKSTEGTLWTQLQKGAHLDLHLHVGQAASWELMDSLPSFTVTAEETALPRSQHCKRASYLLLSIFSQRACCQLR